RAHPTSSPRGPKPRRSTTTPTTTARPTTTSPSRARRPTEPPRRRRLPLPPTPRARKSEPTPATQPAEPEKPVATTPATTATAPAGWPARLVDFLTEQFEFSNAYAWVLIAVVVFAAYANSFNVPFLFDDAPVITRN